MRRGVDQLANEGGCFHVSPPLVWLGDPHARVYLLLLVGSVEWSFRFRCGVAQPEDQADDRRDEDTGGQRADCRWWCALLRSAQHRGRGSGGSTDVPLHDDRTSHPGVRLAEESERARCPERDRG